MGIMKWEDLVQGCVNLESGNSIKNSHGFLGRQEKPIFCEDNCIHCFFCWFFCPDNAIIIEKDRVCGINYDHCKGCGICSSECPVHKSPIPIVMVDEKMET